MSRRASPGPGMERTYRRRRAVAGTMLLALLAAILVAVRGGDGGASDPPREVLRLRPSPDVVVYE